MLPPLLLMVSVAPTACLLLTSVPLHHHGSFFKDETSYENHDLRAGQGIHRFIVQIPSRLFFKCQDNSI